MDLEAQGKATEGSGRKTVGREEGVGVRSDRKVAGRQQSHRPSSAPWAQALGDSLEFTRTGSSRRGTVVNESD